MAFLTVVKRATDMATRAMDSMIAAEKATDIHPLAIMAETALTTLAKKATALLKTAKAGMAMQTKAAEATVSMPTAIGLPLITATKVAAMVNR